MFFSYYFHENKQYLLTVKLDTVMRKRFIG